MIDVSNRGRTIREYVDSDLSFILGTWLQSYRFDSPRTWMVPRDIYFEEHQRVILKIIEQEQAQILVCCDVSMPELIYGYVCFEPNIVHYVYVKKPFRNDGIMKELLVEAQLPLPLSGVFFTHYTNAVKELQGVSKCAAQFNPYLMEKIDG